MLSLGLFHCLSYLSNSEFVEHQIVYGFILGNQLNLNAVFLSFFLAGSVICELDEQQLECGDIEPMSGVVEICQLKELEQLQLGLYFIRNKIPFSHDY